MNEMEVIFRWVGGVDILITLMAIFYGLWRGLQRTPGRTSGRNLGLLRSPVFYFLASLGYFGLCAWMWRPIPLDFSTAGRAFMLSVGSLLLFPGLGLVLWGRVALGREYFVSTSMGAQLFTGHKLVTNGPYALVRHPMYLGLLLTGVGGLILYRTWTFVFVTLGFVGVIRRAWREEQALAAEFGQAWQDYCQRVPLLVPFSSPDSVQKLNTRMNPSMSALLELGVLFLPALPAYLWMWKNLKGGENEVIQSMVYLYILAGGLFVGLRRWSWDQLGFNLKGIWLTAGCGLVILAARLMIIFAINWGIQVPGLTWLRAAWDIFFYTALVGMVEELMFRGLLYRLFEDWRGVRWAIWGSSILFGFWHVFGQGLAAGAATAAIGLLFALIRWRAGGITGLIVLHALWDIESAWLVAASNTELLGNLANISVTNMMMIRVGTVLLLVVPVYLWVVYPRVYRKKFIGG